MALPTRFWLFPLAVIASLAIVILPVFGTTSSTTSITMNPDGGYNVLVAVDPESELPDDNLIRYLSKMRFSFQVFSASLSYASNKRFYINHMEVLLPASWNVPVYPATTQIYAKSHIRLSSKHKYFRVDNPHRCSQPGNFINVPLDLFYSNSWNTVYGGSWKAMLTQWVRYRYGAWEEHGYPGDDYFPYYYKHPGKTNQWTPNGCSDAEISGQFLNTDNTTCDASSETYPSDLCRFIPDWDFDFNENVTTSLMSSHWLGNVNKFCDAENHNRYAPNRQNKYCDHKSVWQTIQESSDYKAVTAPPPLDVTMLDIYTFAESEYPRLIIFVDLQNGNDANIRSRINVELAKIFGTFGLWGSNVAKIVSFPPLDADDMIRTGVEWNTLEEGRALFQEELNSKSSFFDKSDTSADFSVALLALLRDNAHIPNEVNFIVVRASDGATNAALENDLLATLLDNPNLRLNTIEVGAAPGQESLKYLTAAAGGQFAAVESEAEIKTAVVPLINNVKARCKVARSPEAEVRFRNLYRGSLKPATSNIITLPQTQEVFSELEILVSSPVPLPLENLFIQPMPSSNRKPVSSLQVTSRSEWARSNSSGRILYSLRVSETLLANSKKWQIHYDFCSSGDCQPSIVHIFGKTLPKGESTVPMMADTDENVILQVQTSASNNNLDGSLQNHVLILVTVSKSGQPLSNLKITATITSNSSQASSVILSDAGNGQPDLEPADGVYTGLFVPETNGLYDIQVLATSANSASSGADDGGSESRFHYPDQTSLNCAPNTLPGAVTACSRLVASPSFHKQAGTFLRVQNLPLEPKFVPLKTTDLQGYFDNKTGVVTLTFTSPLKPASSIRSAGSAAVFQSDKIEDLLDSIHEDHRFQTYDLAEEESQVVRFRPVNLNTEILYYAIQSIAGDISSATSNLVAIHIPESSRKLRSSSSLVAESFEDLPKNLKLISAKSSTPNEEGSSSKSGGVLRNPLVLTAIAFGGILVSIMLVLLGIKKYHDYYHPDS